jgi:hypothetical protein
MRAQAPRDNAVTRKRERGSDGHRVPLPLSLSRILTSYALVRRPRIMPNPRRPAANNASVDGSGAPTGTPSDSFASDWALTAKLTAPNPGNVTERPPTGVRSCKVPVSRRFPLASVLGKFPRGGKPISGTVSGSERNVARNPTVVVPDTKLSSSRMSLTPFPPPSPVMVPWLVICLLKSNVLVPVTVPRLRLADSLLVVIVAPTMSVVTVIGSVASLNEIAAALARVVPTEQTPMSAGGTTAASYSWIDSSIQPTFPSDERLARHIVNGARSG